MMRSDSSLRVNEWSRPRNPDPLARESFVLRDAVDDLTEVDAIIQPANPEHDQQRDQE